MSFKEITCKGTTFWLGFTKLFDFHKIRHEVLTHIILILLHIWLQRCQNSIAWSHFVLEILGLVFEQRTLLFRVDFIVGAQLIELFFDVKRLFCGL